MSGVKSSKIFTLSNRNFPFLKLNSTFMTDSGTDPDAKLYINRVIADGGTIVDAAEISAAIKQAKKDGWYSNCQFWFGGMGGYKVTGSGISTWYNMGGSQVPALANDATQTNDSFRPTFAASVSTQANKPGVRFDSTGADNGRFFSLVNMQSKFPSAGSVVVSFWVDSDDLYSVFGTISNDQWWRVGGGGQYPGMWRNSRCNNLGSASTFSGNQYSTYISSAAGFSSYQNGSLNFSTTADFNSGNDYRICDTTGRNDRSLRGYVTEIIGLSVAIDTTTRGVIETRLKTRYGL